MIGALIAMIALVASTVSMTGTLIAHDGFRRFHRFDQIIIFDNLGFPLFPFFLFPPFAPAPLPPFAPF